MLSMHNSIHYKRILPLLLIVLILLGLEWYTGSKYSNIRKQGDGKYYRWDKQTFWRLRPWIDTTVNGRSVHSNSKGFRGTEEYSIEPTHDVRILVLGDSRAYGIAVDDDNTFSQILENTLRQKNIDAEVLNAGTPGYTIVQCRAKLEQLLTYKPDIAILAAGHNDRRYLVLTQPDDPKTFSRISTIRKMVDVLQWSNIFLGMSYELGKRKLETIRTHPPGLDTVSVRVPGQTYQMELERFVDICETNQIQPILMKIEQNPCVFEIPERAARHYREGRSQQAIDILEKALPNLHVAAIAYSHYVLGQCYQALGNESKARDYFTNHQPGGSLHGEAILRSQANYSQILDDRSAQSNIPAVNAKEAICQVNDYLHNPGLQNYLDTFEQDEFTLLDGTPYVNRVDGKVTDLKNFFRGRFVDECHYGKAGHILMGLALAETVMNLQTP